MGWDYFLFQSGSLICDESKYFVKYLEILENRFRKMPDSVLPYGGAFVVQLDQQYGSPLFWRLCNSEIILWVASFSLKNMPDFVVSYGRRFPAMQSDEKA